MPSTERKKPIILLTGQPGVGKSTAIKQIVSLLGDRAGGFYTQEVRAGGRRTGFKIVTVDGQMDYLATKDPAITFSRDVPFRGYKINLEAIETIAVPSLYRALEQDQVIIIDEIGPMEFISERFRQAVLEILDSEAVGVGTIVQRPNAFADQVKAHHRVEVRPVSIGNRDQMARQIYTELVRYLSNDPF